MSLLQDIRFGARTLFHSPGFAITSVITLSLGIGATTAIFSVSDALLWKPFPLPRMETLVMVLQRTTTNRINGTTQHAGRCDGYPARPDDRSRTGQLGSTAWPTWWARAASRSASSKAW